MEPDPALSGRFEGLDLLPALQQGVQEAGFVELRPIQAAALPEALKGRDVLGLARTGTGKTAAFALPILQRLEERPASVAFNFNNDPLSFPLFILFEINTPEVLNTLPSGFIDFGH